MSQGSYAASHAISLVGVPGVDRLVAHRDAPAESVPELVELFRSHPKLPEA